jgi:dephospho-CoA kinase
VLTRPGGPIDRRKLGDHVFNNTTALQQLERIVHPAVRAEIGEWLEQVAHGSGHGSREQPLDRPVAVIDAIKLLESIWAEQCNSIWVVTCTEEQQVARLIQTRGMHETEARQRVAAQPPQSSRLANADVVIDNSGSQEETRTQVEAAWTRIVGHS